MPRRSSRWTVAVCVAAVLVGSSSTSVSAAEPAALPDLPEDGSAVPTVTPAQLEGCDLFPADTVYHADVRNAPAVSSSEAELEEFAGMLSGSVGVQIPTEYYMGIRYGIPYRLANASTPRQRLRIEYPYYMWETGHPIPAGMDVEDISDHHGIVLETDACDLYEYWILRYWGFWFGPNFYGWVTDGAAPKWDLNSYSYFVRNVNNGPQSATATGLAILPLLLRPEEVRSGRIDHPLYFTVPGTEQGTVRWPARTTDGTATATGALPMGTWLRLRSDFSEAGLSDEATTIIRGLKVHGMILGDTGGSSNNAFSVMPQASSEWDDPDLTTAVADVEGALSSLFDGDDEHIWEIVDANDFKVADTSTQVS